MYYHYLTLKGIDEKKLKKLQTIQSEQSRELAVGLKCIFGHQKLSLSPKNAPRRDNNCCVYRQG